MIKTNRKKSVKKTEQLGKQGNSDKVVNNENLNIQDLTKTPKLTVDISGKEENIDVFKPRLSIVRTPPLGTKEDQNENVHAPNKRQRSETSPETQANKRRQYSVMQDESQKVDLSEGIILQMFSSLDQINKISNKTSTDISNEDQTMLKEAHTNLHKLLTLIVFNCGSLEKENVIMRNQLHMQDLTKHRDHSLNQHENDLEEDIRPSKPAYADITKRRSNIDSATINNIPTATEQWKTPPTIKKFDTVIHMKSVKNPKDAIKLFKSEINQKDIGRGFKSIKQTKTGGILIESFDKNQQDKLKNAIRGKENIKFKDNSDFDPMFTITGINKGFSDGEFLKELENLNYEIVEGLGYSVYDKIQVITKKQCRNPEKENWILQAPPDIAKWFLKKGTVFFDFVKVYVQEHFNLALCFKCSGFGHVAKHCSGKECCPKCGEEHAAKDCKEENVKCPNCTKLKHNETNHSARDKDCPVYQRRLARLKNNINYGAFL